MNVEFSVIQNKCVCIGWGLLPPFNTNTIAHNVQGFALCGLLAIRFDTEENGRFNFFKKWARF